MNKRSIHLLFALLVVTIAAVGCSSSDTVAPAQNDVVQKDLSDDGPIVISGRVFYHNHQPVGSGIPVNISVNRVPTDVVNTNFNGYFHWRSDDVWPNSGVCASALGKAECGVWDGDTIEVLITGTKHVPPVVPGEDPISDIP